MGFGIVGTGVAEMLAAGKVCLRTESEEIPVELKYILDVREFPDHPLGDKVIHDIDIILNDPEVYVVTECIGGKTIAYDFVKRCLKAGKHVCTCNKEMIADRGLELLALAKENNVMLLFEASVGGGIPLLRPLRTCLDGNDFIEIRGIINGTTNYILNEMLTKGTAFADALAEAQALGYAEKNPAADVEGIDACRKICILADLAYGFNVPTEIVSTEGITNITVEDTKAAASLGYAVKLLGRTLRGEDGKVYAYVAPHFVPNSNVLAGINGVMNAVSIIGDYVNEVVLAGPGAGRRPTASAVVGDIIDTVRLADGKAYPSWGEFRPEEWGDIDNLKSRRYVAFKGNASVPAQGEFDGVSYVITDSIDNKALSALFEGAEIIASYRILD